MITELIYPADESNVYIQMVNGEEHSIDIVWEELQLENGALLLETKFQNRSKLTNLDRVIELLILHNLRCDRLKKLGAKWLENLQ